MANPLAKLQNEETGWVLLLRVSGGRGSDLFGSVLATDLVSVSSAGDVEDN